MNLADREVTYLFCLGLDFVHWVSFLLSARDATLGRLGPDAPVNRQIADHRAIVDMPPVAWPSSSTRLLALTEDAVAITLNDLVVGSCLKPGH